MLCHVILAITKTVCIKTFHRILTALSAPFHYRKRIERSPRLVRISGPGNSKDARSEAQRRAHRQRRHLAQKQWQSSHALAQNQRQRFTMILKAGVYFLFF